MIEIIYINLSIQMVLYKIENKLIFFTFLHYEDSKKYK